jgi:predicted AAA+ superfamily ATPase
MNTLLRTLLYEWRDRTIPQVIPRELSIDLSSQPGTIHATVLTGFRRVGKTYLIYQAIETLLKTHSRQDVVYINFEDERMVPPETNLLTDLIPEIQALFGKKPAFLFLDELQIVPNWSKWVRRILDTEPIQLVITGSSSKMGSVELPTELRGRSLEMNVSPLSFREYLHFNGEVLEYDKIPFVKTEESRFRFLMDEYLTFGGLPAVVLTQQGKKQELLQSYFQTVIQRDIAERHHIGNDIALRTLLKLLLNSPTITISKLHNSLKSMGIPVGKSTVDNYLTYIKNSYFMNELYIHTPSVINQTQYPRKTYFVDTGFITALSTKFSKNSGRLFENIVFQKLAHKFDEIYYYKDNRGYEVDFITRDAEEITGLYQVCYDLSDEDTRNREVRSLVKAGESLHCDNLSIITLDHPDNRQIPREIKIIPAAEFFLA